jgi:hypothetical protein
VRIAFEHKGFENMKEKVFAVRGNEVYYGF